MSDLHNDTDTAKKWEENYELLLKREKKLKPEEFNSEVLSMIEIESEKTEQYITGILYSILTLSNEITSYIKLITYSEETVNVSMKYLGIYLQEVEEISNLTATNIMIIVNDSYKISPNSVVEIIEYIMQTISYNPQLNSLQLLCTSLISFLKDNIKELSTEIHQYTFYWVLKLMQYHYDNTDLLLKEKDVLLYIWNNYRNECLDIGDDVIRLASMVDKIDIVKTIFKNLFEDNFKLYHILASKHTDEEFYELLFSHKLLKYLEFYFTLKDNANDKYYFKWISDRCLSKNKEVVIDIIRYINYVDTELDRSKIIKYLLQFTDDTYIFTNIKLSFSFDWIFCLPNVDESIYILLPSFSLIMNNLQTDSELVNTLIEFIIILSRKFCPVLMQELCRNLHCAFVLFKRVYQDMRKILDCVNLSKNIVNVIKNDYKDVFEDTTIAVPVNNIPLHQNYEVSYHSNPNTKDESASADASKRKANKDNTNNNNTNQTQIKRIKLDENENIQQKPTILQNPYQSVTPTSQIQSIPVVSPIVNVQQPMQILPLAQQQQQHQQTSDEKISNIPPPQQPPPQQPQQPQQLPYTIPTFIDPYNPPMQCITPQPPIQVLPPTIPPTISPPQTIVVTTISPINIYPNPSNEVINVNISLFNDYVKDNFNTELFRKLINEECKGKNIKLIVSKMVEIYTLQYPCMNMVLSIKNAFFDKDIIVSKLNQFIKQLFEYYPFLVVFLMIDCISFTSNLFLPFFQKLLHAINKSDNELYYEMFYYYKKLLDNNGIPISPLELIISNSLKSLVPHYSYSLLHSKEILHILVTIMPENTKLEVMTSLRKEEWFCFNQTYIPIFNSLDDWTIVEQHRLWDIALSQASFHEFIPQIKMSGSLTYILNVIRDYSIAVELLTALPEGYDDFIFSYFRYYNRLDPVGFQFALKNVILKKPEIVVILSIWKDKYPDIALCDFLKEKIDDYIQKN